MAIRKRSFYWMWLKRVFSGAHGIISIVAVIASLVFGGVVYCVPALEAPLDILTWSLPLAVGVLTIAFWCVYAPYDICREVDEHRELTANELKAMRTTPTLGDVREYLIALADQLGEQVQSHQAEKREYARCVVADARKSVEQRIIDSLRPHHLAEFKRECRQLPDSDNQIVLQKCRRYDAEWLRKRADTISGYDINPSFRLTESTVT